ncbi:hypothetical protein [Sorangium sp. So ce394]|uniref:hypothetical protein n=1 Tax=Sorangium sp. So ce394 TaxID=3133310 RepID=UPI003F5C878F
MFPFYNGVRPHSALGYVTPNELLAGRAKAIWAERGLNLEVARETRRQRPSAAKAVGPNYPIQSTNDISHGGAYFTSVSCSIPIGKSYITALTIDEQ